MWVSLGGPSDKLAVIFDDDPSRGHEVALRLLDGYEGYLQSDGYAGYDAASTKLKLIQLGCWDHCQRKFKEAQAAQPGKTQGRTKADIALDKIGKLYRIEREIKTLSAEEKRRQRQLKESARVTRSKAVERQKQRKISKRRPDIQSAGLYE